MTRRPGGPTLNENLFGRLVRTRYQDIQYQDCRCYRNGSSIFRMSVDGLR